MAANNAVAAVILGQREKFVKEFAWKDAGIAPLAVMRRADNAARMLTPALHDALDRCGI